MVEKVLLFLESIKKFTYLLKYKDSIYVCQKKITVTKLVLKIISTIIAVIIIVFFFSNCYHLKFTNNNL